MYKYLGSRLSEDFTIEFSNPIPGEVLYELCLGVSTRGEPVSTDWSKGMYFISRVDGGALGPSGFSNLIGETYSENMFFDLINNAYGYRTEINEDTHDGHICPETLAGDIDAISRAIDAIIDAVMNSTQVNYTVVIKQSNVDISGEAIESIRKITKPLGGDIIMQDIVGRNDLGVTQLAYKDVPLEILWAIESDWSVLRYITVINADGQLKVPDEYASEMYSSGSFRFLNFPTTKRYGCCFPVYRVYSIPNEDTELDEWPDTTWLTKGSKASQYLYIPIKGLNFFRSSMRQRITLDMIETEHRTESIISEFIDPNRRETVFPEGLNVQAEVNQEEEKEEIKEEIKEEKEPENRCPICGVIIEKDKRYCERHEGYGKQCKDYDYRTDDVTISNYQGVVQSTNADSPVSTWPAMQQRDTISLNVKNGLDDFYEERGGLNYDNIKQNCGLYDIDEEFKIKLSSIDKLSFFDAVFYSLLNAAQTIKKSNKYISDTDIKTIAMSNKYRKYYNSINPGYMVYLPEEKDNELIVLKGPSKMGIEESKKESIIRIYEYTKKMLTDIGGKEIAERFERNIKMRTSLTEIPKSFKDTDYRVVITNDPEKKIEGLFANEELDSCQNPGNSSSYALGAFDFVVSDCHVPIFIYDEYSEDGDYDKDSIVGRMNTRLMYDTSGDGYLLVDRLYTHDCVSGVAKEIYTSVIGGLLKLGYPIVVSDITQHDRSTVLDYIDGSFDVSNFSGGSLRTQERYRGYNPFSYYHDSGTLSYARNGGTLMYDKINEKNIYLVKPKDGVSQKVFKIS